MHGFAKDAEERVPGDARRIGTDADPWGTLRRVMEFVGNAIRLHGGAKSVQIDNNHQVVEKYQKLLIMYRDFE